MKLKKTHINHRLQGFVAGALVATLCVGGTVFAKKATETITASYNDIKIYKDNELCEFKDVNGDTVEPFIYNGTTYLPVRGTANLAGMEVTWVGDTQSVYLWDELLPDDIAFVDECPPYDTYFCDVYSHGNKFTMGDELYTDGLMLRSDESYALFHLDGQYSNLQCTIGHASYEEYEKNVTFVVDDQIIETVHLEANCSPKTVSIPLSYGQELKICSGGHIFAGVGNIIVEK